MRRSSALLLLAIPWIASAQPSTVILVRHAERAAEPPRDPVLSELGAVRARDLAAALRDAGITSIITTQLARTQLTAKPIADAVAVAPIVVAAGGPLAAHVDSVAAAVLRREPGEVVLVVGHSNTIPGLANLIAKKEIFRPLLESEYGVIWVIRMKKGVLTRLLHMTMSVDGEHAMCGREKPDDRVPRGAVLRDAMHQHRERALPNGSAMEHVRTSLSCSRPRVLLRS